MTTYSRQTEEKDKHIMCSLAFFLFFLEKEVRCSAASTETSW